MRVRKVISSVIAAALLTGCSGQLQEQVKKLEREKAVAEAKAARFRADSIAKDTYLASITSLLNQIEDGLEKIAVEKEQLALTIESDGDSKRFARTRSLPQKLDRIASKLNRNNEQIAKLELLLAGRGQETLGLKAVVERLKKQNGVFTKQIMVFKRKIGILTKDVEKLTTEVAELGTKVVDKQGEVEQKEAVISEQEEELQELQRSEAERWRGFFIVGTPRELEAEGIIDRKGLLRRQLVLADTLLDSEDRFDKIADIRTIKEIPVSAKRGSVQILPERPQDSYSIQIRGGQSVIVITDFDKFWRFRHLVVVKK